MNLYAILSPWDVDRGRFEVIGLAGEVKRLAWCRCGNGEKREGRRSVMLVAMPGISGKKETIGRLAWSKIPVTITSLASVCGMLAGSCTEHGNQAWRRTIEQ